jgi:outer membrane protein TolC
VKQESLVVPVIAIAVPPDLQQRIRQLTLVDVVDLALLNNPATRASWAQARAAADL